MAKNFTNLRKETNTQMQKAQRIKKEKKKKDKLK